MRAALLVLVGGACACSAPRQATPRLTAEQIADAMPLHEARAFARPPTATYRQTLSILIRDEVSGRGFEGRGVVAVMPGHALRMVLLGPGGTTAMDAWIRDGRWRVAIPALDRVVRGDRSTPRSTMRGLPIDLLERWLITPWGGKVVTLHRGTVRVDGSIGGGGGFVAWLLRDGGTEVREETLHHARAWFFDHGRLVGTVEGSQREMPEGRFAVDVKYRGIDPAMTVSVRAERPAFGTLPESTFADPDPPEKAR